MYMHILQVYMYMHVSAYVYHSNINIRVMIVSGSKSACLLATTDGSGPVGDVL